MSSPNSANKYGRQHAVFRDDAGASVHYNVIEKRRSIVQSEDTSPDREQKYGELRERTERHRRRHERFIERIAEEQRRRLRSFRGQTAVGEPDVTESIEGPAPAEDSSVPSDRPGEPPPVHHAR
jgi:hypothetical protein